MNSDICESHIPIPLLSLSNKEPPFMSPTEIVTGLSIANFNNLQAV